MTWKDRIAIDPDVLVGKPVVKGTRIAVEFVIDLLARGWTTEQILDEYDHLKAEDILACLTYAGELLKSERVNHPVSLVRCTPFVGPSPHASDHRQPIGLDGSILGCD